jgi:hypothetical protein
MNRKQHGMYRGEQAKWEAACRALGRPCDDAARRALHKKVGAPHSSADFSQDDLTAVIGEFKAVSAMDDFKAQLKAQGTLKERHLAEIERLTKTTGINGGLKGVSRYYSKFLGGIPVERHGDKTLGKLVGMMNARAKKLAAAPAPVPTSAIVTAVDPDFDPEQPFG